MKWSYKTRPVAGRVRQGGKDEQESFSWMVESVVPCC